MIPSVQNEHELGAYLVSNRWVFLDCFATWCGPCKVITPLVERHSRQYDSVGHLLTLKFDIDEDDELASILKIRSVPTFILFENGREVKRMTGVLPSELQELYEMTKQ